MSKSSLRASALAVVLSLFLAACSSSESVEGDSGTPGGGSASAKWFDYDRSEEFAGMQQLPEQKIEMSDGVKLSVKVALPEDAEGNVINVRMPVILTQTGYNKSLATVIPAFPTFNSYFVQRGYAHVAVDVRGTGVSEGDWEAFSEREQLDYKEVMDWVAVQPWSNGKVGTWGPSFMGITQIFTAAHQHPAHKTVFAIVPMGDAYRDIVFSGGQVNVGFIPLWMALVTGLGVLPAEAQLSTPFTSIDHAVDAVLRFQVPTILSAALGTNDRNYDSDFWRTRSPIEVADRVKVPTFIVGGLNDIFQRGEPMLYEVIKRNTTTKLLIGPWQHLTASTGAGLPLDGVPNLDHIALMWFDKYLKGLPTGAERVPNVTQFLTGEGHYSIANDWPHPQARAERWYLRGDNSLTRELPAADEASHITLPIPVAGLCSLSTSQWTAGILGLIPLPVGCLQGDNGINELPLLGAVTYTTAPMDKDYYINGPIQADLWISSAMADAGIAARITDVSPEGTSQELTNGILTASMREVDVSRSRLLRGVMIQPWHPYTEASRQPLTAGEPVLASVEIFPTSTVIKQGHSLRIAISTSDFPHGLPPVTDLLDQLLGVLTVRSDREHPSSVVVPVVPVSAIEAPR
ncbi:CocE/NonD family hydrolase [Solimonas sp. K1W22B-7]|uniref:CocE/NonD family hydrolase n=1 Tax=Solimonas sp. K1W22B-7 TaxID=2303331 RepID=UPI000E336747|nr:CocE/NonD family hydrolase [Solimonas sp. K1W22B-7]AXQ31403.1 CocE/NonD family hydrolase [Solimonas sp. K1W22B-7]